MASVGQLTGLGSRGGPTVGGLLWALLTSVQDLLASLDGGP